MVQTIEAQTYFLGDLGIVCDEVVHDLQLELGLQLAVACSEQLGEFIRRPSCSGLESKLS